MYAVPITPMATAHSEISKGYDFLTFESFSHDTGHHPGAPYHKNKCLELGCPAGGLLDCHYSPVYIF